MKTKSQKRLEAIQRLESSTLLSVDPRSNRPVDQRQQIVSKRHAEAKRLRQAFSL